jgi:mannose-6-phosphate isomerase
MLYPLKFIPRFFEKIWGGQKLKTVLGKPIPAGNIGESWEISSVSNEVSVLANGSLQNNTLNELIEIYMTDLLGEKVYDKYGEEFPLLIKFIDAHNTLSVQVHPNDELAKERHYAYGKTEMWYVVDVEPDSCIYIGFNKNLSKEEFLHHIEQGTVESILNKVPVNKGDVFFIPAGRIHAIGKGILLAEIQQTSDITYRVFDWNRKDNNGSLRELHIEEALDVLDYNKLENTKISYQMLANQPNELVSCQYFTTNLYILNKQILREYEFLDSFKILIFIDGNGEIRYEKHNEQYKKGDVYLIPAELNYIELIPSAISHFLEVYIK